MQRLLSQAVWEAALLVIAESSFPKRGDKSAGVGVQYCGTTGQVENCHVGVFLAYVTARGHSRISRELYVLPDWIEDHQRRQAVGIPESVGFQTRPELARRMLERMWDAQMPIAWVVADTVYGDNLDLRTWLHAHGYAFVLAVPCNDPVGIVEPSGRRRQVQVRDVPALLLNPQDWQRLSMSEGTKGPRLFDWACVPTLHQWQQDGQHWLRLASERERSARPLLLLRLRATCHHAARDGAGRWRRGGTSRKIVQIRLIWAWTTTRSGVGSGGIVTSRS